jgi:hypothetical protein
MSTCSPRFATRCIASRRVGARRIHQRRCSRPAVRITIPTQSTSSFQNVSGQHWKTPKLALLEMLPGPPTAEDITEERVSRRAISEHHRGKRLGTSGCESKQCFCNSNPKTGSSSGPVGNGIPPICCRRMCRWDSTKFNLRI